MNILKSIILNTNDDEIKISTPVVEAQSFESAIKKFKDQEILGILKLEDDEYMVFIEE
jgi:arginine repressor